MAISIDHKYGHKPHKSQAHLLKYPIPDLVHNTAYLLPVK